MIYQPYIYPPDIQNVEDLYERPDIVRAAFEVALSIDIGGSESE